MIGMVHVEFIKKKHLQEGWSIRHIAKHLCINRATVRKAIAMTEVPRYRLTAEKSAPVTGPIKAVIKQWLKEDQERPGKQRHTARRVYSRLVEEHSFSGSESSVRKYVQKLRGQISEAFIPLEADAGKMGQVDWGTAISRIDGVERTIHLSMLLHQSHCARPYFLRKLLTRFHGIHGSIFSHSRASKKTGGIHTSFCYRRG